MRENIAKIDKWLAESGVKEYRLGLMACANGRAVERIRNGTASVSSLTAVLDHISRNPSDGNSD